MPVQPDGSWKDGDRSLSRLDVQNLRNYAQFLEGKGRSIQWMKDLYGEDFFTKGQ